MKPCKPHKLWVPISFPPQWITRTSGDACKKHRLSMVGTTRSQVKPLIPLQVILYLESIPRLQNFPPFQQLKNRQSKWNLQNLASVSKDAFTLTWGGCYKDECRTDKHLIPIYHWI